MVMKELTTEQLQIIKRLLRAHCRQYVDEIVLDIIIKLDKIIEERISNS